MSTGAVKNHLQRMDNYDFEHFVADLWERQGWNCAVSQASVDAGIDVTATKSIPYDQKKLIQAKRYGEDTTVGGPDIQQYASLKHQQPDVDSVVVVTTSSFTRSAEERARELNVKLVDGDDLEDLVDRLDADDLIEKYLPEYGQPDQSEEAGDGNGHARTNETNAPSGEEPLLGEKRGAVSPDASTGGLRDVEQSREWHRLVPMGIGLWFVALFLTATLEGILPPVADVIGFGVVLPLMVAIPVAWCFDMDYVRNNSEWSPSATWYIGGSLFLGPLPLLYYYYRRYRTIGL